jgi:hypothetical protein
VRHARRVMHVRRGLAMGGRVSSPRGRRPRPALLTLARAHTHAARERGRELVRAREGERLRERERAEKSLRASSLVRCGGYHTRRSITLLCTLMRACYGHESE